MLVITNNIHYQDDTTRFALFSYKHYVIMQLSTSSIINIIMLVIGSDVLEGEATVDSLFPFIFPPIHTDNLTQSIILLSIKTDQCHCYIEVLSISALVNIHLIVIVTMQRLLWPHKLKILLCHDTWHTGLHYTRFDRYV